MLNNEQKVTYYRIIDQLKAKNIRITSVRKAIIEIVLSCDHPTAAKIVDALKEQFGKVNVMSVYNTIDLLLDLHILSASTFNGKQITYEIVSHNKAHFTCLKCHRVFHVSVDKYEKQLDDILQSAGNGIGFKLDHYKIEGHGICADCLARQNK